MPGVFEVLSSQKLFTRTFGDRHVPHRILGDGHYNYLHFIEVEVKAQRG